MSENNFRNNKMKKKQLTDGISGFGSFQGLSVRTKTKAVFGTDTEQILLSVDEVWDHQGLSSASWVHLQQRDQSQVLLPALSLSLLDSSSCERWSCTLVQAFPLTDFFSIK